MEQTDSAAPPTDVELQEAIERRQQERVAACVVAVNAALAEHRCVLTATPGYVRAGNGAWVTTVTITIEPAA